MKKWKKKKPNAKIAGIPNNHRKLPVGQVLNAEKPLKGKYLTLPLFGWVAVRDQTDDPLVMLATLILDEESLLPQGTFQVELPVFEENVEPILAALDRYGWDGRVWPIDDGWPTGDEVNEAQVAALMEQANLRATMTFPPGEEGNQSVQEVNIQRAQGPFLMPPLPKAETESDPAKKARLMNMCENPRQFYAPVQPAVAEEREVRVTEPDPVYH